MGVRVLRNYNRIAYSVCRFATNVLLLKYFEKKMENFGFSSKMTFLSGLSKLELKPQKLPYKKRNPGTNPNQEEDRN